MRGEEGEWEEESWIGVCGEGVAEAKSGCVDRERGRLLAFLFINTLLEESSIDVGTTIGGRPCSAMISLKLEIKISGFSSPYESRSLMVPTAHK